MEAAALLVGLLMLVAFGLALIGTPILFSRYGELRQKIQQLNTELDTLQKQFGKIKETMGQGPELSSTESVESSPPANPALKTPEQTPSRSAPNLTGLVAKNPDVSVVNTNAAPTDSVKKTTTATRNPQHTESVDKNTATVTRAKTKVDQVDSVANKPTKSASPAWWQPILTKIMAMNVTAQVGAIVLIFGAIFLGKYASDIGVLTLVAKLWLMGGASLGVIAAGIIFYRRLHIYGAILQGTGFAGWLITLFVAHVLFGYMHWLWVLVLGLSSVLLIGQRAWQQNSQLLAMVAFLGGFLTPFIASSEVSSLWRLFGYLSLLNLGVVYIATQKPWRWLVREAYVASFGLLSLLMLAEYLQRDLSAWAIQLPMAFFVGTCTLLFSLLAWQWLRSAQLEFIKHASGLLFGVPAAAALAIQLLFVNAPYATAGCFVGFGLWYAGIWFYSRLVPFAGIAIVFVSAAIPFALSDGLTSLVYSIEGAAFAYWAIVQNKRLSFLWGLALQMVAAGFAFHLLQDAQVRTEQWYVSWFLHLGIVAAGLSTAWYLKKFQQPFRQWQLKIETGVLAWALFFWLYHWAFWLSESFSGQTAMFSFLINMGLTLAALHLSSKSLSWPLLQKFIPLLSILFAVCSALFLVEYGNSANVWLLMLLVVMLVTLFTARIYLIRFLGKPNNWDAFILWFGLSGLASTALIKIPSIQTDWHYVLASVIPALMGWQLQPLLKRLFRPNALRPFSRWLSIAILLVLVFWSFSLIGNYSPLPFWPLLHPVLIIAFLMLAVIYPLVRARMALRIILLVVCGILLTVELNRNLFHYAGVSFNAQAWLASALTQMVWSLVWAFIGGVLMVYGARWAKSRMHWYTGAVVLAAIVIKLFILDLANVDTLFRIISFTSVGALLLVIGYFAPLPKEVSSSAEASEMKVR